MKWASAVCETSDLETAVGRTALAIQEQLRGAVPDLALVFAAEAYRESFARLPELLRPRLGSPVMLGCSAGGVIGGGRELEARPGLVVMAALLPDVTIRPFHLPSGARPDGFVRAQLGLMQQPTVRPDFVLLGDPFSAGTEMLLPTLDQEFPGSQLIGGLASGTRGPGDTALFMNGQVLHEGVVGVALWGNLRVETVVAQGCRAVGDPLFVTRADGNRIYELDGQNPAAILGQLLEQLGQDDRELARSSLFLGIAPSRPNAAYRQGDFLIRNVVGLEQDTGALVMGAEPANNSVVQFHLRDAATSKADIEAMLGQLGGAPGHQPPLGALLFSCLGRGAGLYGEPDHDSQVFHRHLGEVPLAGFFCNGEIGPVQGMTCLHGYTSAFGLFAPKETE
jgi:small ligand-binding sensory domain FIST